MFRALGRTVGALILVAIYFGAIGELVFAPSVMQQIAAILVLGFLTLILAVVGAGNKQERLLTEIRDYSRKLDVAQNVTVK